MGGDKSKTRERWSPTRIRLVEEHCPKALDLAETVPVDRTVFDAGTAAHHVLQAAGEQQKHEGRVLESEEYEAVAADVLRRLVSDGRRFEGRHEPPLNATRAAEGLELALDYLTFWGLPLAAEYERALAVDENWEPTKWDDRWFGCILDVLHLEEDFMTEEVSLVVTDYKTSWRAGPQELETLQRKGQALVALAHYPDVDSVTLRLVNLRTQGEFKKTIPADSRVLARWRGELTTIIGAMSGARKAAPGGGCYGCPYLLSCEEGQDFFRRSEAILDAGSDEERAIAYATAVAMVGKLRDVLKPVVGDGTIRAGDTEVGYVLQQRRRAATGAWKALWQKWLSRGGDLDGFLALHQPSVTQIEATAKALWPDRADADRRARFVEQLTEPDNRAAFQALKTK